MTKIKRDILDLSYEELAAYLKSIGEPPFRASQVFEWIYQRGVQRFNDMSNLSSGLRARMNDNFDLLEPAVLQKDVSSDGTMKVLFELHDREKVETVLIPTATRVTLCVSTQAGCKFGCRFCASGIGGFKRNLSCAEILSQILYMKRAACDRRLSHIVFMGVGEPLDNYDNLMKAIRNINSPKGINIAARRITVSTCGLVPKIKKLAQESLQIELAVSLHGASDASRGILMPVNKKYPVDDLIDSCRQYNKSTKRQITFEYILIKDVTCTDKAAKEISRLLKGLLCKINLIPYNPVSEFDHEPPSRNKIFAFKNQLERVGVHATIRTPRGKDVSAACGQLRHTV
ncbi:MAG: 23S rRNA (adenine(2503)-C(2))-methyltransferase RlmN [Candidatus Omnitrophica bacterium]|nr:23S rRNA (adenine(2503)-C(2))-methyltransferase RlmN [Candidatus Omnitrophota bacterium]MCK5260127.1 23S rRNA (adenine(2503)-C(2))-methyltransferase RlmN [Candidatus Omnitrophota bacterium]